MTILINEQIINLDVLRNWFPLLIGCFRFHSYSDLDGYQCGLESDGERFARAWSCRTQSQNMFKNLLQQGDARRNQGRKKKH